MKKLAALLFVLVTAVCVAQPVLTPPVFIPITGGGGSPTLFSLPTGDSIHYLSPTGSDSANGLTPATAWLTPNHAGLNCGDVLVAAAGAYHSGFRITSQPSNCPSTSGGIDGTGGIYFAIVLCGAADLGSSGCQTDCTPSCGAGPLGRPTGIDISVDNWAVIGWQVNGTTTPTVVTGNWGFTTDACAASTPIKHHIAFINDIATNVGDGFFISDCGHSGLTCCTADYLAVIGSIAENAAMGDGGGICVAGIDIVSPGNFDTVAGNHLLVYGNFSYQTTLTNCTTDQESYMFDTWDFHGYTQQGVASNNMGWVTNRFGFQAYDQNLTSALSTAYFVNNSLYANGQRLVANDPGNQGVINTQAAPGPGGSVFSSTLIVQNNIAEANLARVPGGPTGVGGDHNYALQNGGNYPGVTFGGTGTQNVAHGVTDSCASTCNSPRFDVVTFGPSGTLGTNIYPAVELFANTTDLLANWVGTPNCTGFATTTACMGYNVTTQTLTALTPISDLRPSAGCGSSCNGKGYQLPSSTCSASAANGLYPTWLKGIVRLAWNTTTSQVFQMHDLVTTPCGL